MKKEYIWNATKKGFKAFCDFWMTIEKNPEIEPVEPLDDNDFFEPAASKTLRITPSNFSFLKLVDIWNREVYEIEVIRFTRILDNKKTELKDCKDKYRKDQLIHNIDFIKALLSNRKDSYILHADDKLREESKFVVNEIYARKPELKDLNFTISHIWLTHQKTNLKKVFDHFELLRAEMTVQLQNANIIEKPEPAEVIEEEGGGSSKVVLKPKKNKSNKPT